MTEAEKIAALDKIGVRFDQFIIAVNGALIAYSVKLIQNEVFAWKLLPLGLAILCWVLSFYFGISSIRRLISTRMVGIFGQRLEVKAYSDLTKLVSDKFQEVGGLANKNNSRMYRMLFLGGILFIVWQLIEMALRTMEQ